MSVFPILKFNDDYFETEKRDGYVVERLTKHAWAAEMEVLAEIDSVCKRHGLRYFAEWGTMLGAVRHKGFIPWDDDLDIAMFRDDLMTFSTAERCLARSGTRASYPGMMILMSQCLGVNI